jgi:Transposase
MVVLGVDAHKRTHTVVAVDDLGRQLGERTTGTTSDDHLGLLSWAEMFDGDRLWAIEDCRHLSRRLEGDLLAAGERIVRVPTKLMAHARDAARSYGKSDPIDAVAVARAALREPDLPAAHLDGPAREVRLLVDHRDNLVAERTRAINRLRWHLHELDQSWAAAGPLPVAAETSARYPEPTGRCCRNGRPVGAWAGRALPSAVDRDPPAGQGTRRAHPRAGSDAAGAVWVRDADRGEDRRRDGRCPPVPVSPCLRPPQRHRTPFRSGRATVNDIDSAGQATGNSTRPSIASPSPKRTTTPTRGGSSNAGEMTATPSRNPSGH